MPNFAAFLAYVLISCFSPGPNTIISMTNAGRYGFKRGIKFNMGIFLGVLILTTLCSIFTMALYSLIPSIKPVMASPGAAYILWLAWKIFTSKPESGDTTRRPTNSFLFGMLLQFVIPNAILYSITTLSTFIVPYYKSAAILSIFCLSMASIAFGATCCWALFGSAFQRFIVKNNKIVNTLMALLLVYCAVSLFL